MAEAQPTKKKRLIKDPETFRERLQRGAAPESKSKRSLNPLGRGPFKAVSRFLAPIGRFIIPKYFRASWGELKLVTWPSGKEGRRLTFAVLIFAVVFGAAIAGVDWGVDKLFQRLLLK